MFTGIIEEVGAIARRNGPDLAIVADRVTKSLELGDSIAIDGACMTIAALNEGNFVVQVSQESCARSTLGLLKPGYAVNLERPVQPSARFGGHFVLGHIDGVGRVKSLQEQGGFAVWRFQAPPEVTKYLVPKGSIAIDGISLTVVEPESDSFGVALIPATLRKTTLSSKQIGDPVNMEADMIGKHIYHYIKDGAKNGLTHDLLAKHGFA